jgi:hypothetical protein
MPGKTQLNESERRMITREEQGEQREKKNQELEVKEQSSEKGTKARRGDLIPERSNLTLYAANHFADRSKKHPSALV